MVIKQRIVGEVSRNWVNDGSTTSYPATSIRSDFEHIIEMNAMRGFVLESWHYRTVPVCGPGGETLSINETIIAVFCKGAGE